MSSASAYSRLLRGRSSQHHRHQQHSSNTSSYHHRGVRLLPILAGVSWLDDRRHRCHGSFFTFKSGDSRSLTSADTNTNIKTYAKTTTFMEPKQNNDKNNNTKKNKPGEVFDITKNWKKMQNEAAETFWKSSIFTATKEEEEEANEEEEAKKEAANKTNDNDNNNNNENTMSDFNLSTVKSFFGLLDDDSKQQQQQQQAITKQQQQKTTAGKATAAGSSSNNGFQEMAASFASILSVGGSEESIQRIVQQARQSAEEGEEVVNNETSNEEVMSVLKHYAEELKKTADTVLGDVDFSQLYPSSLFYYIEHSDSIKTPSWKRQQHRFFSGIDIQRMDELNSYLQLADLSYADTVESIQKGLENHKTPYEVVYVNTDSQPNRPAHFVAVKRSQKSWSPWLEVIMCVRGTKTIEDAITDLLCEDEDYKGGKAHSGVLEGGKFLAKKHKKLFQDLLKSSGKPKLNLTLVGHSLGAGAASIIAMEYYDEKDFGVNVIGFGCPAIVSKDLSESAKHYITTVVADDDCVPRLSAATIVNSLLDIMEYDYVPYARRDVKHAFSELQRLYPMIVTDLVSKKVIDLIDPLIDQYLGGAIKKPSSQRMDQVLFPPGNIIHFYRDGVGVTGSVVPCDFFEELHVSRRMVDDHLFFTGYQQIFLELMRQTHQDHNFRFDTPSTKK